MTSKLTYQERAKHSTNNTAIKLLTLIERKKTNLAISLDVTTTTEFLKIADQLGPFICVLKTHIDIIEDFSSDFITKLQRLADKHEFLIFEDRKFADIGNTVSLQYGKGIYHIADWAPITNAHTVPGEGVIHGLKKVGLSKGNALLLLAEMSSKGNLAVGSYTDATVKMAEANKDFVIGFITQHQLTADPAFINFTPGINLVSQGDALGQQYVTPQKAIVENGSDIIIVGRGIYEAADPIAEAEKYRKAGWTAYEQR